MLFSVDHVRLGPVGQRTSRSGKPKVFVSNGRDVPLHGVALIFLRTQPTVAVTDTNMSKVCESLASFLKNLKANLFKIAFPP